MGAKKGEKYKCEICGVKIIVDEDCNCEVCDILCCGKQLKKVEKEIEE